MAKEFKISTLRLKELEQELQYLKTTREKEVAEQIKEARSFGPRTANTTRQKMSRRSFMAVSRRSRTSLRTRSSSTRPRKLQA